MKTLTTLVFATLVVLLLPGCAQKGTDAATTSPGAVPSASASTAAPLSAAPPSPNGQQITAQTAFELRTNVSAKGSLASYSYTIPKGAIQTEEPFPGFTFSDLYFQLAPVVGSDVKGGLEQWSLMVFQVVDGASDLRATYSSSKETGTSGIGPLATSLNQAVETSTGIFGMGASDLKAGDQVFFVLGAKGSKAGDLSVVLKPITHQVNYNKDRPKDAASLGAAVRLPPYALGDGFQLAEYTQFTSLFAFTGEYGTPYAKVADQLPRNDIGATVRDVTINAPGFEGGYSYADGEYFSGEAHGLWSAAGNLHGKAVDSHSLIASDITLPVVGGVLWLAEVIVLGLPFYTFQGDGTGASDLAFHVQTASVNEFQVLTYSKLDFGTSLAKLTGAPALSGGFGDTGLAGNIPPSAHAGAMLFVRGDRLVQVDPDGRWFQTPWHGTPVDN